MKEPLLEMCFGHDELVWHFFLDEHSRLCYRNSPKETKNWSDQEILQNSYGGQFIVALGPREQLHLAAVDEENIIRHHHFAAGMWNSSKVGRVHPLMEVNDLKLTVDSLGRVHLLSCSRLSRQSSEWHITHFFGDGTIWNSFLLDTGMGISEAKASAAIDENDNLHVIYSAPDVSYSPLIHKVFDISSCTWKSTEQIPLLHKENQQPCAVFDKIGSLHLVWTCSDGRNFRTVYTRRKNAPWPEGGWDIPEYISEKGANAYSPYLLIAGDSIIALWQQLNGVLYRVSGNLGQTWDKTEQQTSVKNLNDYALNYFSPSDKDISHLSAFSSSAQQITLSAAASFWKDSDTQENAQTTSMTAIGEKEIVQNTPSSSVTKKFLLEYSDTCLTNKLMNQTIDLHEQNIELLIQERQNLNTRLKRQSRELRLFKALSEIYRKEAESLKASQYQLERNIEILKNTVDNLEQEKADLTNALENMKKTKFPYIHRQKQIPYKMITPKDLD